MSNKRPRKNPNSMSTGTVAKMLGTSDHSVIKWAQDGDIAYHRTPGGHYRFRLEDVEAFRSRMYRADEYTSPTSLLKAEVARLRAIIARASALGKDYRSATTVEDMVFILDEVDED